MKRPRCRGGVVGAETDSVTPTGPPKQMTSERRKINYVLHSIINTQTTRLLQSEPTHDIIYGRGLLHLNNEKKRNAIIININVRPSSGMNDYNHIRYPTMKRIQCMQVQAHALSLSILFC